MNNIDLSKYVGKKVKCTFNYDHTPPLIGVVQKLGSRNFPYDIGSYHFDKGGEGVSQPRIATITVIDTMNGPAQRHPNINLNDFEGKVCYVKWDDGGTYLGKVWFDQEEAFWVCGLTVELLMDGTLCGSTSHITEIYGEGAYEIKTRETFDEPTDEAVEKAKEAIKDLSEEQIAKLLHSLKK